MNKIYDYYRLYMTLYTKTWVTLLALPLFL